MMLPKMILILTKLMFHMKKKKKKKILNRLVKERALEFDDIKYMIDNLVNKYSDSKMSQKNLEIIKCH